MASASGPRCVALVGPYLSGKTSLMESLLSVSEGIHRKGSIKEGNTVGDSAPEARARQMSVEISVGSTAYLEDEWTFLDCPGSIEMRQEALNALMVADLAVVVYEPSTERAMTLAPLFKVLADRGIPHMVFINKIDTITEPVSAVYEALRSVEHAPLVLRQIPIRDGETVSGYVDLISGRAYKYTAGAGSERIDMPDSVAEEYELTRESMLEALADFNDELLEKLLEDEVPDIDEIYGYLTEGVRAADVVPVLIGSAEQDYGVRRLFKALRHEVPGLDAAIERLGIETGDGTAAQVFKTYHAQHAGKLSLARVLSGSVNEGMTLNGQRVGSLQSLMGGQQNKIASAGPGAVAALGRMDEVRTGDLLVDADGDANGVDWPQPIGPVYSRAISPENRNDEVKLTGALQRLNEEDPSVSYEQNADTREMVLWGQGEIHLQVALEKLKGRYNVSAVAAPPSVPYKETIRKTVSQHGRFKRQTGGHGMFGDVHVDISPRPRGEGFEFTDKIVGGAIPKQFIPAVEVGRQGIRRTRAARLPGGRLRGAADRRAVPPGRQQRDVLQARRPGGDDRGHAQMRPGPARTHFQGRDRRAGGFHQQGARADQRPARPDPRLRAQGGLEGLGYGGSQYPELGYRRPDHRAALAEPGRRHLSVVLRPPAGTDRAPRRPGDRGPQGGRGGQLGKGGVGTSRRRTERCR